MNTSTDDLERRVREAVRAEAASIQPREALSAIRERTAAKAPSRRPERRTSHRGWWATAGAAALATAATVIAVTVISGQNQSGGPDPATVSQPVNVYYLDKTPETLGEGVEKFVDAPKLYREVHEVETAGGEARAAVQELLMSEPVDSDYTNPWLEVGAELNSVELTRRGDDQLVVVDLTAAPPGSPEVIPVLQQLQWTVRDAYNTNAGVQVKVNGEVEYRRVQRTSPRQDFAALWIESPAQGVTVTSPVQFRGMARTFEANVVLELSQGDTVIETWATTARQAFTWSPWSTERELQPGDYTIAAFEEDQATGNRIFVDTKDFTVE